MNALEQTYYENWPEPLRAYTMRTEVVLLTNEDRGVIGSIAGCERPDQKNCKILQDKIAAAMAEFPVLNGVFIKLSSRSPKDNYHGYKHGFKCMNSLYALKLLTDSERMIEDSQLPDVNLLIREWIDIPQKSEVRCFRRDGKLIAASQYFYDAVYKGFWKSVAEDIARFHDVIGKYLPADVVFDVMHRERVFDDSELPMLIELNPFDHLTDPCLFKWDELDANDPFQFRYNVTSPENIPLIGEGKV